jgi:quaternary ammonium compound-resistance protein SugE
MPPDLGGQQHENPSANEKEPIMAWVILVGAGLLEIVWATALKNAEGFTRLWPSVIGITFSLVSFFMLAVALRSLPVGTAYAVWVGIGVVGVAITGMLAFGESVSLLRLGFIAVILFGVIGLRIVEG